MRRIPDPRRQAKGITALVAVACIAATATSAQDRSLDPLAPVAAAAGTQNRAGEQLAEMAFALNKCGDLFAESWSVSAYRSCDATLTQLGVFEDRFGTDPRSLPGWASVRAAAQRVLQRVDALSMRPSTESLEGPTDCSTYAFRDSESARKLVQLSMTSVLGRYDEAASLAASVDPSANDGCIFCTSDNVMVLAQRQSEIEERRGDLPAALHFQLVALSGIGSVSEPAWMQYRCGRLLERCDHHAEARAVWAEIAAPDASARAEFPAAASSLAAARMNSTPERSFPAATLVRFGFAPRTVLAVAPTGDTRDLRLLITWVPKEGSLAGSPITLIRPDTDTASTELRELLGPSRWSDDWMVQSAALVALAGLPGQAANFVPEFLDQCAASSATVNERESVRTALALVLGGEPRADAAPSGVTNEEFAQAWRSWMIAR